MKRLYIAILSLFAFCGVVMLVPATASAEVNVFDQACNPTDAKARGASGSSELCSVSGADPITGTNGTIGKVTRLIAYIAGVAAIILMIIGGIMYVISNGDSSRVSAARNTVIYAAIGLVIVVMAQG